MPISLRILLAPLFFILCIPAISKADLILSYGSDGGADANFAATGVTATPLSEVGLTKGTGLAWTGFTNALFRQGDDFIEWSFASVTPILLSNLQVNVSSTSSGPSSLDLLVSVNNSGFNPVGSPIDVFANNPQLRTIDLTSLASASSASFRLFGYSATASNGQLLLPDASAMGTTTALVLNGTAVPEPGTLGILAASIAAIGFRRSRKLKRSHLGSLVA